MRITIYLIAALVILALQTAVVAGLPAGRGCYDLLIPLAVYLSLFRAFSTGFAVVLTSGFLADMISGAPNGMFMAVLLMVFLLFRNTAGYFHAGERFLFTLCTAAGVLLENLAFFFCLGFAQMAVPDIFAHVKLFFVQLAWVFVTAPLIYHLLAAGFRRVDQLNTRLAGKV
ncbi:MAG: hypothetical protein R6X08_08485 [Desulfosalsimonadaceae bacterium]